MLFKNKQIVNPFRINYAFVNSFVPMDKDPLVQFAVTFSNSQDADFSQVNVIAHVCLVLDISGSMNQADKYPFLLEAIPCVINTLSDNDWLSIIIFSSRSELIWSKDIKSSRGNEGEIIQRIEQSGVKFEQTYLSTGLKIALQEIHYFAQYQPDVVNRLYILTDGQLHDSEDCCYFTPYIQNLGIEINSYGFGQDFAEETIREIMNGCKGGRIKCIYEKEKLPNEFAYIGERTRMLIATDAELELKLSPRVIPGDAFRFEPGTHCFGTIDDRTRLFTTQIGGLEKGRVYKFAFEARLQPSQRDREQIATATLSYNFQGQKQTISENIFINRTNDQWRYSNTDDEIKGWFDWLDGLRKNDPQAQMKSLQARLRVLRQEGADPAQIVLIEQVIDKLAREGTLDGLSVVEERRLRADNISIGLPNEGDEDELPRPSW